MMVGSIGGRASVGLPLSLVVLGCALRAWATPLPARTLGTARLHDLSVPFIENTGQIDPTVSYYAATRSSTVFVTREGQVVYALRPRRADGSASVQTPTAAPRAAWNVTESFVGGRVAPRAGQRAETEVSWFVGNDPARWRAQVPTYTEVGLGEVYPGIVVALEVHGNEVEKVFTVRPGARPKIRVRLTGAESLTVNADGALVIRTGAGDVQLTAPRAYQEADGQRQAVKVAYEVAGDTYRFRVAAYDRRRPLVIDPVFQSTYLGGSADDEVTSSIAISPTTGDVYVGGVTASTDFMGVSGGAGGNDAFVARLNASLTTLQSVAYLGGTLDDRAIDITIHPTTGYVYVFGMTTSTDFPITAGAFQTSNHGGSFGWDAFVARLSSDLTTLIGATYLGGTDGDEVAAEGAIAIHPLTGEVFITGDTWSGDFPGTGSGFQMAHGGGNYDGYVARLSADLGTVVGATYFGGSSVDLGSAIAIDPAGDVYVVGETNGLPASYTTSYGGGAGGAQPAIGGARDAFVAKFDISLATLLNATYLGGPDDEEGFALALNTAGDVYLAGIDDGPGFPTTAGAAQPSSGGGIEFFVGRLKGDLSPPVLGATYFGGSGDDPGLTFYENVVLEVHPTTGELYLAGRTTSTDLQNTAGGNQSANAGGADAVIARFKPDLTAVSQVTYLGGSLDEGAIGLAIDAAANQVYVAGRTLSSDFPGTSGGAQSGNAGNREGFVARLAANLAAATPTPTATSTPTPTCHSTPVCGNGVREGSEECDFGSGAGGHNGDPLVDKCSITCTCLHPTGNDVDCDGVDDGCDNCVGSTCPLVGHDPWYNPDQRNTDCAPNGTKDGCLDGGDVCDPCPARDDNTQCDHALSGGINAGPATQTVLSLPSGGPDITTHPPKATISITVPPFALCADTSISVTNLLGPMNAFSVKVAKYALRPQGLHFDTPATVALGWDDADNDGVVNQGVCTNSATTTCDQASDCPPVPPGATCPGGGTPESSLVLTRNGSANEFGKDGFSCSGASCKCPYHDPLTNAASCPNVPTPAHARCTDPQGMLCASVARACSQPGNQWAFETCDFSSIVLGEPAADLIPGGGPPTTDCFMEWDVEDPFNTPATDTAGLPSRIQTCTDGDPACDMDATVDGACTFRVSLCFNDDDPRLMSGGVPACTAADVALWELRRPFPTSANPIDAANGIALRDTVAALATSTIGGSNQQLVTFAPAVAMSGVCTSQADVRVPHTTRPGRKVLKARATTTPPPGKTRGVRDTDKLKLVCLPPS